MIERILTTNQAISPKAPSALKADDIMLLADLMKLMGPFKQGTLQTPVKSFVTISTIVSVVCELGEKYSCIIRTNTTESIKDFCHYYEGVIIDQKADVLEYWKVK